MAATASAAVVVSTDLAEEVSAVAALVRDSAGPVDFRIGIFTVAEITVVSVIAVSEGAIAVFAIVVSAILMAAFSIRAFTASDIHIITTTSTPITTDIRINYNSSPRVDTSGDLDRQKWARLCNRN